MGYIVSLHVGKPKQEHYETATIETAIKRPAVAEAFLTVNGLDGDEVANKIHHGGPDRAICFYPIEHYSFWEAKWGRTLSAPAFGENVLVEGMKEEEVFIGDVYRIGGAIVEITQGRVPCAKISHNNGVPEFLESVLKTGFTGYFGRVLAEGAIQSGQSIHLMDRKQDQVSVLYANQILLQGQDGLGGIEKLLEMGYLAEVWRNNLEKKRKKLQSKNKA
ncbi:MOSC domain-containing protein [Peribacillus saganii]|uniref:MOSC domain-containing protein n=1 Tax=Peribacillus saganii TaxID=2303992 RepID=A0A372LJV3_9BACI|nr:MOSC domain-containing protein [Peribacillus saganii]RFU66411.1 MOSC domain-containing protein [Peribacillus saganii]